MNIVVLLKRTFDTEEQIIIQKEQIEQDGVEFIINPYDEYALEEAIQLKEEHGGEVTVISVGPSEVEKQIRTALAMGADKGILVNVEEKLLDERGISMVLKEVIQSLPYDLILAGHLSIDNGAGQVALRLAELLDIVHVSTITRLTIEDQKATLERDVEGDVEIVEASLPALFTAQQGLNEPRYPSLPGIMKAKRKPLKIMELDDINLSVEELHNQIKLIQLFTPSKKEEGKILEGELEEQVQELVQLLQTEAKVL